MARALDRQRCTLGQFAQALGYRPEAVQAVIDGTQHDSRVAVMLWGLIEYELGATPADAFLVSLGRT